MVSRGVPQSRARVYRLPTNNADLKQKWLSLHSRDKKKAAKAGDAAYPSVPDEVDLIGFITTGNFNLSEGKAIGIGSLLLSKVLMLEEDTEEGAEQVVRNKVSHSSAADAHQNMCIVRDAGESIGRLARWMLV
jgi:ribonuclease P/MRP protein subunit POP1